MQVSGCRLTEKQQDRLAEFFVAGVTARTAADLLGITRKTAASFYHRLRQVIAREMVHNSPFEGKVEIDESYFGVHRKGKRGRGAARKVAVFGILKRAGKVYTVMPPDLAGDTRTLTKGATLMSEPFQSTADLLPKGQHNDAVE